MAKMQIPRNDFVPHPEGQHEGEIILIEDLGMKETSFGSKHKIAVRIASSTARMDDGEPYIVQQWFTLSGHEKSSLRKFREMVLARKLTNDEAYNFDPDAELKDKKVGFVIVHNEGREGVVFANIQAIWPLKNGSAAPPAQGSGKPDSAAIGRAIRLIAYAVEKGIYDEQKGKQGEEWAENKADAAGLARFIERITQELKVKGFELPAGHMPAAPESDSDLPF
jgi:hypothetical protein